MAALEYDTKDYKSNQRSGKQIEANRNLSKAAQMSIWETNFECWNMHDPCSDQFDETADDFLGSVACIEKSWSKGDGSDSVEYHSFDYQTSATFDYWPRLPTLSCSRTYWLSNG
jgi:hypothetical protein